jgi:hypothetical protein
MDSDLVRLQVLGDYQVNAPHLQALCEQARQLLQRFFAWRLEPTPTSPARRTGNDRTL